MSEREQHRREAVLTQVQQSLGQAQSHAKRFRKWDVALLLVSIVLGTLTTVLAGGTAASGDAAAAMLGGWRLVCLVVAVLAAAGTIAGALHQSFRVTDRLSEAVTCVAKLQSLQLALSMTDVDARDAAETYRQILVEHAKSLT